MYSTLIFFHSIFRWIVLVILIFSIYRSYRGYVSESSFTKTDNALRHWTATLFHVQLIIGMILYFQSPIVKYFRENFQEAIKNADVLFFGIIHISLMVMAIILVTIGSAWSKRRLTDKEKFKTMLTWFSLVLLIIIIAIPWPFSPFANRPFFRFY